MADEDFEKELDEGEWNEKVGAAVDKALSERELSVAAKYRI